MTGPPPTPLWPQPDVRYRFSLLTPDCDLTGTVRQIMWDAREVPERAFDSSAPPLSRRTVYIRPKTILLAGDGSRFDVHGDFDGERVLRWEAVAWFERTDS